MNATIKPTNHGGDLEAVCAALGGMEPHIYDLKRVAGILMHLGDTKSIIDPGEVSWLGQRLFEHAEPLLAAFLKASAEVQS